jgi:hypothetical protein
MPQKKMSNEVLLASAMTKLMIIDGAATDDQGETCF